jgi:hypothetical protein
MSFIDKISQAEKVGQIQHPHPKSVKRKKVGQMQHPEYALKSASLVEPTV